MAMALNEKHMPFLVFFDLAQGSGADQTGEMVQTLRGAV